MKRKTVAPTLLVVSLLSFSASAGSILGSNDPFQRFEGWMRSYFAGKSKGFRASALLIDGKELRITVLNPEISLFHTRPSPEDDISSDAKLNQECYQAVQIVSIAKSYLPQGDDPAYFDYRKWKWPITVEWGWTKSETVEVMLKRRTFTAKQIQRSQLIKLCVQP